MNRPLLITTAAIEGPTGLALIAAPSVITQLLIGAPLEAPAAQVLARVAGAAILSLAAACWLARSGGRPVVASMLLYNVLVIAVLLHAALALALRGIGLWPALGLHLLLALWCGACLRKSSVKPEHARISL